MKTESVIDMPKSDGLCEDIWEKVLSYDGTTFTWQLNNNAEAIIASIAEQLDRQLDLGSYTLRITGSITSNAYTENADVDLHFVMPEFIARHSSADAANAALQLAYREVTPNTIRTHPVEVYCQPNPYQDYMSVGCYDVKTKTWEVGPDIKPLDFDPYSEYYKDVQSASEGLAADIRNQVLAAYEKAVVCKKMLNSSDMSMFDQSFAELAQLLAKSGMLFDQIRKMRKVFSSPTSKEEALSMRASRKWKIADASFKLFDKYGYLAILKQFKTLSQLICKDELITPKAEIIDALIAAVKHDIGNPEKLADAEDLEEGIGAAVKAGALAFLLAVPGIVSAKQIEVARANASSYSLAVKDVNSKVEKVGKYSAFQAANIIARTLYAEAREDGKDGYKNVATVIYNRAKGNKADFVNVIKTASQFSCWNKMTSSEWSPSGFKVRAPKSAASNSENKQLWEDAKAIAASMLNGTFKPLGNANHYYNPAKASPTWGPQLTGVKTVGSHKFGYLKNHRPFM